MQLMKIMRTSLINWFFKLSSFAVAFSKSEEERNNKNMEGDPATIY